MFQHFNRDIFLRAISLLGGSTAKRTAVGNAHQLSPGTAQLPIPLLAGMAVRNNRLIVASFRMVTGITLLSVINRVRDAVTNIFTQLLSLINQFVQFITRVIATAIRTLMILVQTVAAFIGNLLRELITSFMKTLAKVTNLMRSVVETLIRYALNALSRLAGFIVRFVKSLIPGSSPPGNISDIAGKYDPGKAEPGIESPGTTDKTAALTAVGLAATTIAAALGGILKLLAGGSSVLSGIINPLLTVLLMIVLGGISLPLILLLIRLFGLITRPSSAPAASPSAGPAGTEYQPGDKMSIKYSVPLVNDQIQASEGEKLIFGIRAEDKDKMKAPGSSAWTEIQGTGPYETRYEVSGDAEFLSPGSGKKTHTVQGLQSVNIYLYLPRSWNKQTVHVKAVLRDNALPAVSPDTGSTKDPDQTINWTIIPRKRPNPEGLKRVSGPDESFVPAPAFYTYEGMPMRPPARPNYENQSVLESFGQTDALGFTMNDLRPEWKAANPQLDTPDKVAAHLYGGSSNGTFIFNNQDRIMDKHYGFGEIRPFVPAALSRPNGVGYRKFQTYSCGSTVIGFAIIDRQYTNSRGVEIKKTDP